jgi:hypothetical protein
VAVPEAARERLPVLAEEHLMDFALSVYDFLVLTSTHYDLL